MKKSWLIEMLEALFALFRFAAVYRATEVKVEVERLFFLPSGVSVFLANVSEMFNTSDIVTQRDEFWDNSESWLSAIDSYLRLRTEERNGDFSSAEVKVAYPGAPSNANVRPAIDEDLDAQALDAVRNLCHLLALVVERQYVKERVKCTSRTKFNECAVELEIDAFQEGGRLGGKSFVSFSVEVPGEDRAKAEAALDEAIAAVTSKVTIIDCGPNNYEDFFYGRATIPAVESDGGQ